VREFHGAKLHIKAKPPQPISIDGELAAETPVTVGVARGAVIIAAPREEQKVAA
jgi:diacylglycerol kinase family enzyme